MDSINASLQTLVGSGHVSDPDSPRGRLLATAARLFREKGYERTTVRDLAAAVGIQSGSIFHHFRSKEEILKAVMTDTIHLITHRMRAAVQAGATPLARLRSLIRCELESVHGETGEAMAVLVYEWRSLSPESQEQILKLRAIYEAAVDRHPGCRGQGRAASGQAICGPASTDGRPQLDRNLVSPRW